MTERASNLNWDIDLSGPTGWADLCGKWQGMARCLAAAIRSERLDVVAIVLDSYDRCEDLTALLLEASATEYKVDNE